MKIDEGVLAFLLAQSAITDLVSGRIMADMAPKNTPYPRIVIACPLSTARGTVLRGSVKMPAARCQVDCWGLTKAIAVDVGDAVRTALQAWLDLDASEKTNWGSVVVNGVTIEDQANEYDPPEDSSDRGAYRQRFDLVIWYQE